ncbi:redoxin domain-containing protein [Citreimonas sp.]|uniref:redoxin domain-containing protein n=1 Tax=Citreimonas sp. TaxID=3036715 RepID=UPI004059632C
MLTPGQPVSALTVSTLDGNRFDTTRDLGKAGALVVFYRGAHCPVCKKQLKEIAGAAEKAEKMGLTLLLVSGDDYRKAKSMAEETGVEPRHLGFDLTMTQARDWGLWISTAREGSEEPSLFSEPGIFYVLPDGTLYAAWTQSHPFARPAFDDILSAVQFRLDKDYPARGQYHGPLAEHDGGVKLEAADGPNAEAYGNSSAAD